MSLPPISARRTRILLLAGSYLDACSGVDDGWTRGKPQSRIPGRNPELWPFGSYPDLEHAFDVLDGPEFWTVYVKHGSRLVRDRLGRVVGYEGHPVTRHLPPQLDDRGRMKRKARVETRRAFTPLEEVTLLRAAETLESVDRLLQACPCYVPAVVSENAGYLSSEALTWERRLRAVA